MHDPSKLYLRKNYNWNEDFKDVMLYLYSLEKLMKFIFLKE